MIKSRILLAMLLSLAAIMPAGAADREKTVKFKPGTTSASYRDKTQGRDMVSYYFDARAGQKLVMKFKASLGSCIASVHRPDNLGNVSDSFQNPDMFTATLEDTGRYKVNVFLMRVTARRGLTCKYSIDFDIKD